MTDDLITFMQQTVNDARRQYGDDWELTSIHVKAGKLARLCELAEHESSVDDLLREVYTNLSIAYHNIMVQSTTRPPTRTFMFALERAYTLLQEAGVEYDAASVRGQMERGELHLGDAPEPDEPDEPDGLDYYLDMSAVEPRAFDPALYNHETGDVWVTHPRDKQHE